MECVAARHLVQAVRAKGSEQPLSSLPTRRRRLHSRRAASSRVTMGRRGVTVDPSLPSGCREHGPSIDPLSNSVPPSPQNASHPGIDL